MFSENSKVSGRQLGRMVFVEASGTIAFLSLNSFCKYGSDGVLMMVWVYLFAMIYTMGCFKWANYMCKWKHKKSYRILRAFALIILLAKYICISAIVINAIADMVRLILIPYVSPFIIVAAALVCLFYCVKGGIESRGRASEVLFYFVFIPIVIICFSLLPKITLASVIPTFDINLKEAVLDYLIIIWLFVPAELLVLAKDNYDNTPSVRGNVYAGITLTALVNIAIYIAALGVYGDVTVKTMEYPVLRLMQISGIPGDFLNRQDGIMSVFLVVSMFGCAWALIYHVNELMKVLFTQNKVRKSFKLTIAATVVVVGVLFVADGKSKETIIAADVGGMDLEERQFISSVIVSKEDDNLGFYFEIADSKGGSSEQENVNVKSKYEMVNAKNMQDAKKQISFRLGTNIDYSHMKAILFDKKVMEQQESLQQLINEFSEDLDFGENIVVCALDMNMEIDMKKEYGKNIEMVTRNRKEFKSSEIYRFHKMFSQEEGKVTIPLIDLEGKLVGSGTVTIDMTEWSYRSW